MSLFLNKQDLIYVHSDKNRYNNQVLICISSVATQAEFIPLNSKGAIPIFLGQYQEALDTIKAIKITEKDNPEYFI